MKIVNTLLLIAIITLTMCVIIYRKEDKQVEQKSTRNYSTNKNKSVIVTEYNKKYPKVEIPDTYKGYEVCAQLEIPAISLVTNILKNYSTAALNVSVTKFWGVEPNQIGNFCVAGHNFKNKNMFRNLKNLKLGDKLFVADKEIGKVEYEIFDIYKVYPEDTRCLTPSTDNEREITLITCTTDSKKRIIVKAKEKER